MDGWNTTYWGGLFSGAVLVSGRIIDKIAGWDRVWLKRFFFGDLGCGTITPFYKELKRKNLIYKFNRVRNTSPWS